MHRKTVGSELVVTKHAAGPWWPQEGSFRIKLYKHSGRSLVWTHMVFVLLRGMVCEVICVLLRA
jgi:hypothetical protein